MNSSIDPENSSIEANVIDLLTVFDDLLPGTEEDKGEYEFVYRRRDAYEVRLDASLESGFCAVSLYDKKGNCLSNTCINPCTAIHVLDIKRKCIEVIGGVSGDWIVRCLMSLDGDEILSFDVYDEDEYSLVRDSIRGQT